MTASSQQLINAADPVYMQTPLPIAARELTCLVATYSPYQTMSSFTAVT
jgi:hypothetical protein